MDNLQAIVGVGPATAQKLQNAGYESYHQLSSLTAQELSQRIGIHPLMSERIIESAGTLLEAATSNTTEPDSADDASTVVADEALDQMAKIIGSEIVETLLSKKKTRKKLAKKVSSKKKFRRAFVSELIKELKKA